eukprot:6492739-Amphidinium_carterae.2
MECYIGLSLKGCSALKGLGSMPRASRSRSSERSHHRRQPLSPMRRSYSPRRGTADVPSELNSEAVEEAKKPYKGDHAKGKGCGDRGKGKGKQNYGKSTSHQKGAYPRPWQHQWQWNGTHAAPHPMAWGSFTSSMSANNTYNQTAAPAILNDFQMQQIRAQVAGDLLDDLQVEPSRTERRRGGKRQHCPTASTGSKPWTS